MTTMTTELRRPTRQEIDELYVLTALLAPYTKGEGE